MRQCTRDESMKANDGSDISEFATSFVLGYFQSWGQGLERRIELLNEACKRAGIRARFVQDEKFIGWKGNYPKDLEKAKAFRKELDNSFPSGSVETEICSVINIIQKYKKTSSFMARWLSGR